MFYIYLVYHTFLKLSVNYYIAVFQYAHTGTWLTLVRNLRTEDFFGRKNRVNEIYSWSRGFVFRQKFMIKYKIYRPCLIQEMYVFTFVRKRWVICAVDFTHTRRLHIHVECFETVVPVIFLSETPTFFIGYNYMNRNRNMWQMNRDRRRPPPPLFKF